MLDPIDTPPPGYYSQERRPLDQKTIDELLSAHSGTREVDHFQLMLEELTHRYPFRMHRIIKDMAWLKKQARKRHVRFP
jgi:hypothetical protein